MIIFRKELDNSSVASSSVTASAGSTSTDAMQPLPPPGNIKEKDKDSLRTGDKAIVLFKFKFKPEFIEKGLTFFFKEGMTRGKGEITEIIPVSIDNDPNPDPQRNKRLRFKRRPKGKSTAGPKVAAQSI